jgi:FtsP/CotA-like multicopper oxidase with cupredoxin domain
LGAGGLALGPRAALAQSHGAHAHMPELGATKMFHIHTNPFQVVAIGGQPQADRTWRDTVVVPRPAKGGSTVIRSRFLDYTGVFMLHCHMMNHEEMGMMQAVEVYKD